MMMVFMAANDKRYYGFRSGDGGSRMVLVEEEVEGSGDCCIAGRGNWWWC